jgi:hypothetical protein
MQRHALSEAYGFVCHCATKEQVPLTPYFTKLRSECNSTDDGTNFWDIDTLGQIRTVYHCKCDKIWFHSSSAATVKLI